MKILTSPGTVLITAKPNFSRGRKFDQWPLHAVAYDGKKIDLTGSEQYVYHWIFTLESGTQYNYPIKFFPTEDEALAFDATQKYYISANGYVGFIGEWYNGSIRNLTFDKVNATDWITWLAAH